MFSLARPIAIVFLVAACSPSTTVESTATSTAPSTTTSTTVATSTTTTIDTDIDVCRQGDLGFTGEGLIGAVGDDEGDATQVTRIRWDGAGTCERITIAFTNSNGAPATTLGPTAVSLLGFTGAVRITLPAEMTATAVSDSLLGGSLVDRVFVVRGLSEGLTIDIQAADGVPIHARAFTTTSPSTLVVDVIRDPEESSTPVGVASSRSAVVVTPVPGPNLYPLVVEAYAAPSLRAVHLVLATDDGEALDLAIALDGFSDAWQSIRTDLPDGPSGHATLFVGTVDANGRPLDGATVSIDMP